MTTDIQQKLNSITREVASLRRALYRNPTSEKREGIIKKIEELDAKYEKLLAKLDENRDRQ